MKTLRIPALERQLNKVLSTARDEEVVEFTIEKMLDIIVAQEKEIQKLRSEK